MLGQLDRRETLAIMFAIVSDPATSMMDVFKQTAHPVTAAMVMLDWFLGHPRAQELHRVILEAATATREKSWEKMTMLFVLELILATIFQHVWDFPVVVEMLAQELVNATSIHLWKSPLIKEV
jgi:hypothetical protein